ncbi:MAG TPA: septum formation initiator family protein [Pseudomonadales bacterium]|nr:septum formation initiator family protein [Pseudomonadales bacterium]
MRWLTVVLAIMLLWLQFNFWVGPGSYANVTALQRQMSEQQRINRDLRIENEQLAREVTALKSSLEAVEERARRQLGMIKKGETLYLLGEDQK